MRSARGGFRAAVAALAGFLIAVSAAFAEPRIAGGDLPGRERYRFTDPPGMQIIQPSAPRTVLPDATRRLRCSKADRHRGRHKRTPCDQAP